MGLMPCCLIKRQITIYAFAIIVVTHMVTDTLMLASQHSVSVHMCFVFSQYDLKTTFLNQILTETGIIYTL